MPVPSPTYLLLNTYDEELIDGPPIHHLDLYRLSESSGEMRLDIPQLLATGTALFEWPERLSTMPKQYLEVHMYPLRPVRPASPLDAVRHGIFFHVAPLQEASHEIRRSGKSWLTGVSAPEAGTGEDCRWRVVCVRGVGLPLSQRVAEGRIEVERLGLHPGATSCEPSVRHLRRLQDHTDV